MTVIRPENPDPDPDARLKDPTSVPQTCPRCFALVDGRMVDKHFDWHEEARLGSPGAREWSQWGT